MELIVKGTPEEVAAWQELLENKKLELCMPFGSNGSHKGGSGSVPYFFYLGRDVGCSAKNQGTYELGGRE